MSFEFQNFIKNINASAAITAEEILTLRQWSWPDGAISETEASALFEVNAAIKDKTPEWILCFVEALTDFVVNAVQPKGYVSDDNAKWLMAQIDKDGSVETISELELIVKILEKATNAPDMLRIYALAQIERTILTGNGPSRSGDILRPSVIDLAEVVLLRRMLFAQASDGPASISAAEAEMLFRIKDATLNAENAPEWADFFIRSVGQHILVSTSYDPLSRARAAELETFMDDNQPNVARFMLRMMKSLENPAFDSAFEEFFDEKETVPENVPPPVTELEQHWLNDKINADGALDPIEHALIEFINEENSRPL